MTRKINLPNGKIGNFPDDMSNAEIEAVLQKQFPPSSKTEEAFRYAVQDPLIGLLNFGSRGSASVNNLASALGEKLGSALPDAIQKRLPHAAPKQEPSDFSEMLGVPQGQQNTADRIAQFAGTMAPAVLAPEIPILEEAFSAMRGGKYLSKALANAIPQGLLAGSQSPESPGRTALEGAAIAGPFSAVSQGIKSGSPAIRNFSRVLSALGAGGLGYYGAKGIGAPEPVADLSAVLLGSLGAKGINTQRRVRENILKGVEGTPYQEAVDATNRLGLTYITPAEASTNPFTGSVQGTLGKTEKGARLLYEKGKERAESEEKSIENLFGNIFPKKLEERKSALYEKSKPVEIPQKELNELKENEIFKRASKIVESKSAYKEKLKGVPENSIEYMNQIKRAMDGMIKKARNVDTGEADIIKDTKNNLLERLDTISPEYKEARQLAERGIVRKEIEKLFNKKDETGTNLFKTLLSNKKDYADLQNRFKRLEERASTPEQIESMKNAQQQLEDMKLIFGRLINIPTAKTAEALARGSMSESRSSTQTAMRYLQELLSGGKYDKSAVELITNPYWAKELNKLKEVTKKDKLLAAFHNLLGKVGAQAIT